MKRAADEVQNNDRVLEHDHAGKSERHEPVSCDSAIVTLVTVSVVRSLVTRR